MSFLALISYFGILTGQNTNPIPLKRCPIKTINYEQGLMNSSITNAITDELGLTWFSTKTGLQRYNGYALETITPVANRDTIHINYPVFFKKERNNSILIGYKEGVLEFNARNNSFKKVVSIDQGENLHYSLIPIRADGEGIWCLEENKGLILFKSNHLVVAPIPLLVPSAFDAIFRAEDLFQNNKIIASNDESLFFRLSGSRILEIKLPTHQLKNFDFPGATICGITCNNEQLFISSKDYLSSVLIKDGLTLHKFLFKQITDQPVSFSTLELTEEGYLIVIAERRMFEFDTACRCQKEITTLNGEAIASTGTIPFVYQDKFKRIWVLTLDDIKRIQNVEIPFEHLTYSKEKNNFVRSIYIDEQFHFLVAGCYNGGIQLYDSSGKAAWNTPLMTKDVKDIISIEKLYENFFLIMTLHKGLYVLDIQTRQFQAIKIEETSRSPLMMQDNAYSNNLQRLDDSTILLSTRSNVYRCIFRKNKMISVSALLHLLPPYNYPLTCIMLAKDKSVWVGTESGVILKIDARGSLKTILVPENYFVKCFAEDSVHDVWVGTEKGLFIYSALGKLLTKVTKETGLLSDIIYALLPADSGNNFFASTNLGISLISKDGKVKNFTKELGLQENEFNTQSCALSTTGKLYFGGINGITAFYPADLFSSHDTPFVYITRLVVNDSLYNSFSGVLTSDSIRLDYNQNHLQFDIAAIGLLNPNEYLYKYRMHGFEESWQTTHQPTGIRYTLQPGNFLLEINCSPVLSSNNIFRKRILITINVPWWQTWWFSALGLLMLISIIAIIAWRYNQRKYQKRISSLQLHSEIQNERERISKELHDNIGTQLSYISSNVDWMLDAPVSLSREEEMLRLSAVNTTAKEMISDLRETIWAIKKESIQLYELADKLKVFIQAQRILKPLMEINITEDIAQNISFSPTEALNIFRICQEAIVNGMKHAEASKLSLFIRSGAKAGFSIEIEDNGKGFLQDAEYKDHYGLENMRVRAFELGAKFSIISGNGNGSRIILSKP